MQIEDVFIGLGAAVEMLLEGVTPGEAPTDAQVFHAVSAGLRAIAVRLERERLATVGELSAQVEVLTDRVGALEQMAETREAARDAAYEAAEAARDARAAAAEEARSRLFAELLVELRARHSSRPADERTPAPTPGPRVLRTIARLVASDMKPAAIRRWLTASGWTRKTQRSALLREAAAELLACEPQALWEVVAVVTSDMVWPDLCDTLADLEIAKSGEEATGDVVDLAGARRAAKRRG
ncbi:MAG: hypothetical protein R3B09_35775 [Nannocystaceae bacterium]